MELQTFKERAERSKSIRANRDDRHVMFELDNPDVTYSIQELAVELGFKNNRQLRDRLNSMEKEGLRVFNRAGNNQFQLTAEDVLWLAEYLDFPKYNNPTGSAFVINVVNLKGGVGKSTTTSMLGDGLTLSLSLITQRLRVLVIDLDPQGSASKQVLGDFRPGEYFTSAITLMGMNNQEVSHDIISELSIHNTKNQYLDIIPCTTEDSFLAPKLVERARTNGLKVHELLQRNVIDFVKHQYDVIIIDAGPHLDDVFLSTIGASQGLFTPVPPKELDFDSTLKFVERLPSIFEELVLDGYDISHLSFSKGFMNMWNENPRSTSGKFYNKNAIAELEEVFGEADVLTSHLPNDSVYQRCADSQKTVFSMSSTTYNKELGDGTTFIKAKQEAENWLSCVWKSIRSAHAKIEDK